MLPNVLNELSEYGLETDLLAFSSWCVKIAFLFQTLHFSFG